MRYTKEDLFVGLVFSTSAYNYKIIALGKKVKFINMFSNQEFNYPYDEFLKSLNNGWKVINPKEYSYEIY